MVVDNKIVNLNEYKKQKIYSRFASYTDDEKNRFLFLMREMLKKTSI